MKGLDRNLTSVLRVSTIYAELERTGEKGIANKISKTARSLESFISLLDSN